MNPSIAVEWISPAMTTRPQIQSVAQTFPSEALRALHGVVVFHHRVERLGHGRLADELGLGVDLPAQRVQIGLPPLRRLDAVIQAQHALPRAEQHDRREHRRRDPNEQREPFSR